MDRVWLTEYDAGVPATLDYPSITLPELLDRTVAAYPERVATIFQGARLRYCQLREQVNAFAAALQALGVQPGERVAIMLPNMPQFVVAFYGALRAGAIVVPTNPLYTEHELEHQLADAGATVIVALDQFFLRIQSALVSTSIRTVILADVGTALPRHIRPLFSLKQRREGVHVIPRGGIVYRFEDLLTARGVATIETGDCDSVAVLQYTGGTTGRAKGAMLSHGNLLANALQALAWQGQPSADAATILCAAPFFHVYGLTVCMNVAIASGSTMLLVPRFVPRDVAGLIAKYKPRLFPGVPTMYVALSLLPDIPEHAFDSLEVCISGAAPLPPAVQHGFTSRSHVRLVEGYGLTEAGPVTHCNPVHHSVPEGTIGVPFPDTDAMVVTPNQWDPLPPGEVGELLVSGPQVMKGYWNRPQETARVLRHGWLRTGDMAVMDNRGYFRIVDRLKDMIIAGGFNIYPREIEDVLYAHPRIKEAAVVGVPHDYRGETVKAVIVLKEGEQATAEEIMDFCRQKLASFKVPTIVEFRQELPKTLVGKVLRRKIREEHEETKSDEFTEQTGGYRRGPQDAIHQGWNRLRPDGRL